MIKTPLSTVIGGAFWTPEATILGSASRTLNQIIKSLFANNEQGFAYDPNDLTTMFQDAAGAVPVTGVGQPVGLVLDKSKGLVLGTEFLTNNWNLSGLPDWTYSNGVVSKVGTSAGGGPTQIAKSPFVEGKLYRIEYDVISIAGGLFSIQFLGGTSKQTTWRNIAGKYTEYMFAASGNEFLRAIVNSSNTTCSIKIISVKELKGDHAYQSTSAARPISQNTPRRIDFDTVDDKLITNLPAQLTGCTVIRSVPNVGTQILTGQTIPATYEDNKDHCGLIVINRALTPSETSAITREFNKRAGV